MQFLSGRSEVFFLGSRLIVPVFFLLLSAACAGLITPVSEKNRDASGTYDGRWVATHVFTANTQTVQRWRMNCSEPTESFRMAVVNGVLIAQGSDGAVETYVNTDGKFRLEMPTSSEIREAGGSDFSLSDGKVTIILQGDLSDAEPEGLFTFGIAQLGNSGCTSKYSFAKI